MSLLFMFSNLLENYGVKLFPSKYIMVKRIFGGLGEHKLARKVVQPVVPCSKPMLVAGKLSSTLKIPDAHN